MADRRPIEIACDESGSEGENLVHTNTDVFAHASVHLPAATAAGCVHEIRDRLRSPALEYKANHLLRRKHRAILTWLLGPAGPVRGRALVQLADKRFLLLDRLAGQLAGELPEAAAILYRAGAGAAWPAPWLAFLAAANQLLRTRTRPESAAPVDAFLRTVDQLRLPDNRELAPLLALLRESRPRADALRARLRDHPEQLPPLDPLIPAVVRAAAHWSTGGRPVAIVHDTQTTLAGDRVWRLCRERGVRLAGLRLVDSRDDPRVQIADYLAGVARKLASDDLAGRGDPELTALLPPYLDPGSTWGDRRSWARLRPDPTSGTVARVRRSHAPGL